MGTITISGTKYQQRRLSVLDMTVTADADERMSEAVDRMQALEERLRELDPSGPDTDDVITRRREVRAEMREWVTRFTRARIDMVRAQLVDPPSTDELGALVTSEELDSIVDQLNGVDPTSAPTGAESVSST